PYARGFRHSPLCESDAAKSHEVICTNIDLMNRRTFLGATSTVPLLFQAHAEDGHASLFDGKTLEGWTIQEGPQTAFYVDDGAIVVHESSGFPSWLRSAKQYENFDFRGEFFIKGWMDSGIYFHEIGRAHV